MTRNWRRFLVAISLGFPTSVQVFAQSGLSDSDSFSVSGYQNWLKKSQLPGMSGNGVSKKQLQQPKIWNSENKKIQINAGIVRRYWVEQDTHLDLGMFNTDYQIGISLFSRSGELEFGFAGGKSGGRKEYFRNETDRDNLVLFGPWLLIGDLPVKMNYTEDIKLYGSQLRYWHNVSGSGGKSFQIGLGAHLYVLDKLTKIQAQYEDYGPDVWILNPHYQSSESRSTTLIPGFSLGLRGKTDISSNLGVNEYYLGSLFASGEYVWAKPTVAVSIGNQPVNNFNNLNLTFGWGYSFE